MLQRYAGKSGVTRSSAAAVVETVNYLLLIFAVLWNRHARPVESGSVLLQYLDSQ